SAGRRRAVTKRKRQEVSGNFMAAMVVKSVTAVKLGKTLTLSLLPIRWWPSGRVRGNVRQISLVVVWSFIIDRSWVPRVRGQKATRAPITKSRKFSRRVLTLEPWEG